MRLDRSNVRGFGLAELLVVLGLVGILIVMLLPAFARVQGAASRMTCTNNQRQLGTAIHNFHGDFNRFPGGTHSLDGGEIVKYGEELGKNQMNAVRASTIYVDLLPYIEQGAMADPASQTTGVRGATAVKTFLCPDRRTTKVGTRKDYYCIDSPGFHVGAAPAWGGGKIDKDAKPKVKKEFRSIFGHGSFVTLQTVAANDGTSATLLMAHGALRPKNYEADPRVDDDHFYQPSGTKGANRSGFLKGPISAGLDSDEVDETVCSSPHPKSHPLLFADVSVRPLTYEFLGGEKPPFWVLVSYDDGENVTFPRD